MTIQTKPDDNGNIWTRGDKYYQTWNEYTVSAIPDNSGRINPATGKAEKWRFMAYFGQTVFLDIKSFAPEAKQLCHEHNLHKNNK